MFNPLEPLSRWLRTGGLIFWNRENAGQARPDEDLGTGGERIAADYLKRQGYRILTRQHRQRLGEIDIIAVDRQVIVFVEVKTWRSDHDADPSAAVTLDKQDKITRTALTYLKRHRLLNQPARFDVISVVWNGDPNCQPKIRHFQNAFEATGRGQMFR